MSDSFPNAKAEAVRLPSIYKLMSDITPTYEALGTLRDAFGDSNDTKYNSSHPLDQKQGDAGVAFHNFDLQSRFGSSELDQRSGIYRSADTKGRQGQQNFDASHSRGYDESFNRSKFGSDSPGDEASQARFDETENYNETRRSEVERSKELLARFQNPQYSRIRSGKDTDFSGYEYKQEDPRLQPCMGRSENETSESAGATQANNNYNFRKSFGSLSSTSSGLSSNSSDSSSNDGSVRRSSEESSSEITDQSSRSTGADNGKRSRSISANGFPMPNLYRPSVDGSQVAASDNNDESEERIGECAHCPKIQRLDGHSDDRSSNYLRDFSSSRVAQENQSSTTIHEHPTAVEGAPPSSDPISKLGIGALQPLEPHPKVQNGIKYSKIPVYSFIKSEPVGFPSDSRKDENLHSDLPAVPMIPALRTPEAFLTHGRQSIMHNASGSTPSMSPSRSKYPSGSSHGLTSPGYPVASDTNLPHQHDQSQPATTPSSVVNGDLREVGSHPQVYYGQYTPHFLGNTHYMLSQNGTPAFAPYQAAYSTAPHPSMTPTAGYHTQHPLMQAQQHYLPQSLASQMTPQSTQSVASGYSGPSRHTNYDPFASLQPSNGHEDGPSNYSPQVGDPTTNRSIHVNGTSHSSASHQNDKQSSSRSGNESGQQQPEFHIIDSNTGKHLVAEGPKRRGNLPKDVTSILRGWLTSHLGNPYPTEDDKMSLVAQTGLSMVQVSNWFINARRRSIPASRRKGKLHLDGHTRRDIQGLKNKQDLKDNDKNNDISNNTNNSHAHNNNNNHESS